MGGDPVDVLVVLNTADESEVPLEVADRVAAADPDGIDQTVCSFYPPAADTFDLDVVSLDADGRFDPAAYRRLWALLGDADVVHVHPNAVGAVARVLATARGVPVIDSQHNPHTAFGPAKNLAIGGTNWLSDAVVAVSGAVADSFGRWEDALLRVAGTETVVIPNGVDVAAVQSAADRDSPVDLPAGFVVGGGGRMVPQKNLGVLIEAVARLADDRPDVHLVLTGDGPRRAALEALARELGVADHVTFAGFLDERADVHALYHRIDAFAFPSRYEGWGVAAGEAMAAGLPVVASDVPALREVVGDAGMLVPHDDPGAVADRLAALHDDPGRRERLGEAARERVSERFPVERTAAEHARLYRRVAAGGE